MVDFATLYPPYGAEQPPAIGVEPRAPYGAACCDSTMQPSLLSHITIEAGKISGRPCIRGMRTRMMDILENLARGATREEILESPPYLEDEDITAALLYAARSTDHTVIAVE